MATVARTEAPSSTRDLARNLELVRSAIDLIAAGGASRVTLVGLHDAERALLLAQRLSQEAGLAARAIWSADGDECDIALEGVR